MKKLADIIINALERQLVADKHLFDQAESLLGASTPGELQKALVNPDIPEGRVLLDLLFSPGEDLLLRLEGRLPQKSLSLRQVQSLEQAVLAALPITAKITCSRQAEPADFFLEVPAFGAKRFVHSLKLDANLGKDIPGFLKKRAKNSSLAVRSLVRQADIDWSEAFEGFFLSFLEQADWQADNFMPLVRKALGFVARAPENIAPKPYLESIILWCRMHLEQALQTKEDLAGTNMETRMALGIRPAFVDENRLGQSLWAAEKIYGLVFGPLLPEGPFRVSEQDLNPCNPLDLRLAIRAMLQDER